MNVTIRQVRGDSGVDVWAKNLCRGIISQGHACTVDLRSLWYQFFPSLVKFSTFSGAHDIMHGNSWNGFAFRQEEIPLVVTEHHVIHDPAFNPYRTSFQKLYHTWIFRCEQQSFRAADAVTCDCQYTKEKLEEIFGYRESRVVYIGIDTTLFRPILIDRSKNRIPKDKTILFFAGNLSRRKGVDLLPGIMKELGERFVLLVASGQKGQTFAGSPSIINLGRLGQDELIRTYNLCDIFLTASRLEGFGLSVAEAMACGKPAVATNGSSLPELVVDGKGGFLCRMDDVKDFAEKIKMLADDENLRREMGAFNRKRAEEYFSLETMTKNYLHLYQEITAGR